MKEHDRQLQEIQSWCNANGAGLEILYCPYAVTFVGGIPHPWQITMGHGRLDKEIYHAYGTSMPDAISQCHERWQNGVSGHVWEKVQKQNVSLEDWFVFQQGKNSEDRKR